MNFSLAEVYSLFGGLLGLILMIVILTKMEGRDHVKYSLAVFLFIGALIVIIGSITYSGKAIYFPHIFRLDSPLHYLFGPVCFFYTLVSLKPDFKFRPIQLINLLPFLVNLIEFTPFYFSSAAHKLENYNSLLATGSLILPMHSVIKTTLSLVYLILQWYVFVKYKPLDTTKVKTNHLASWFWVFLLTQSMMLIGLFLNIVAGFRLFDDAYQFTIIVESFYLYAVAIALLFYPALLYGNPVPVVTHKEKYLYSKLTADDKDKILENLVLYLKGEDKPFLNPKISMVDVARLLNVSPQQLSQVVNEKTNLNFNDFINSYRIELAKEILNSPDYSKLTIDAIAEKAGFNSKSPFYIAFKKHTGLTPKAFISVKIESK